MKCGVIRDLLPSYIDRLTSQDSNEIIEEHMQNCKACREFYKEMSDQEFEPVAADVTDQEDLAITKAMRRFRRRVLGSICVAAAAILFFLFMVYFELPMPYEKTKMDVWLSSTWMKHEVTRIDGVEVRWSNGLQFMLPAGGVEFYGSHKAIKEVTIDGKKQCVAFLSVNDTLFYKLRYQNIVEEGNEWGMYYEALSDGHGGYTLPGYDEYDVSDITKVYYLDRGIKWIDGADNERVLDIIEKYGHLVWTKEEGNQSTYYLKVLE